MSSIPQGGVKRWISLFFEEANASLLLILDLSNLLLFLSDIVGSGVG